MNTKTGTALATQWCDKARTLINKRRGKSKDLKAARDQLTDVMNKLESQLLQLQVLHQPTFERHKKTFEKEAEKAFEAANAKGKRDGELMVVAKTLADLLMDVGQAIERQKQINKELASFREAYVKTEIEVAQAKGLRGSRTVGSRVKTAVDAAVELLETAGEGLRVAEQDNDTMALAMARLAFEDIRQHLDDAASAAKEFENEAAAYLKSMKEWGKLKPLVQEAIVELNGMPGARETAGQLQEALNQAVNGIRQVDGVWTGHDKAVEALKVRYLGDLEAARNKHRDELQMSLPDLVVKAQRAYEMELHGYAKFAPAYARQRYEDMARIALERAKEGPSKSEAAIQQLNELTEAIKQDKAVLEREARDAFAARKHFEEAKTAVNEMTGEPSMPQVPLALAQPYILLGDGAVEGLLVQRQWFAATGRLDQATEALNGLLSKFKTDGKAAGVLRTVLEDLLKKVTPLLAFREVSGPAFTLHSRANELLDDLARGDLKEALASYKTGKIIVLDEEMALQPALDWLINRAHGIGACGEKGNDNGASQRLKSATSTVDDKIKDARQQVFKHLSSNKKLNATERQCLLERANQRIDELWDGWLDTRATMKFDEQSVNATLESVSNEVKRVVEGVTRQDPKTQKQEGTELAREKTGKSQAVTRDELRQSIEDLKTKGANVSKEEKLLGQSNPKYDEIASSLEKKRADLLDKRMADLIGKPLKKAGVSEKYRKELEQESDDIRAMFESDDPDLLKVAEDMLQRMQARIGKIAETPKLYADNKKRLERLAWLIGCLQETLPETHRRLNTAVVDEFVAAKQRDPVDMVPRIDELEKQVNLANEAVLVRFDEVKDYRTLKAEVRALFKTMKEVTSTRVTDKAEAFETYYEARILDAKAFKETEGQISSAMAVLKTLKVELEQIIHAPNPEAELRGLDSAQQQNQRLLLDMAMQFEREVSTFVSTTLEQAKAMAKDSEDGDSDMAKSLKGVVRGAKKIVGPYLKNLDLIKSGAQLSPDMGKAKKDFQVARNMLDDARHTAERLIRSSSSTNITGPGLDEEAVIEGLNRLSIKWGQRTRAFDAAVRGVASAIRGAGSDEDEPNKQAADEAAKMVEQQLGALFRNELFASDFSQLTTPSPKDKSGKKALAAKRLVAREAALRSVRKALADIQNPLLMRLTDTASNPFEAVAMRMAAADINTALKEIQLQVLASA